MPKDCAFLIRQDSYHLHGVFAHPPVALGIGIVKMVGHFRKLLKMNNIIAINDNMISGQVLQTVNARELHEFLGSKQKFTDWIKDRINKYGFVKGEDFVIILGRSLNNREITEYFLTLDMAKEISMVENNDQGREARRYFIECEKKAKTQVPQIDLHDPKQLISLLSDYASKVEEQKAELLKTRPKVKILEFLTRSDNKFAITDAAKMLGLRRKDLFQWLHAHSWIYKRTGSSTWHARSEKTKAGYLDTRIYPYEDRSGNSQTQEQVMVTAKGLVKLATLLNVDLEGAA